MFSIFTTTSDYGLIIRTADIQRIEDQEGESALLCWEEHGESQHRSIKGTARENLDRLRSEEFALMAQSELMQRRAQAGYPTTPILRGRK